MNRLATLLLLSALLAGCAAESPPARDEAHQEHEQDNQVQIVDPETTPPGPQVTVEAEPSTLMEAITVTGTVEWATNLTVRVIGREGPRHESNLSAEGDWSAEVPLGLGANQIVVVSDLGTMAAVDVVRLTVATLEVLFTAYPAHEDIVTELQFNLDARPSAGDYDGRDVQHPDAFTVHDLLLTWTLATGLPVEYEYFDGLGYGPIRFDGVGQPLSSDAPPWWCMKVNGETASLGASITEVVPGDVVTWEYGSCIA